MRRPGRWAAGAMLLWAGLAASGEDGVRAGWKAEMRREVSRAAERHGVDPGLAGAVARVESGYEAGAVSNKGAVGVMQLMPATARTLGVANARDYRQNIDGGVRYLRWLQERYHGDTRRVLAAYNAGPGAVDAYGGVPPYRETQRYVGRVMTEYYGAPVSAGSVRREGRIAAGQCSGSAVAFDRSGRMYVRARPAGPGCTPSR